MITVLGAGSIGCYVGGMLAAAGHPVTLIGRPALVEALGGGLTTSAMDGVAHRSQPIVTDDPSALADATLILLCVKSADTRDSGTLIKTYSPPGALVVSLQNGITNPKLLGDRLGPDRVVPGMVGFNVIRRAQDHFAQTTEGEVILAKNGATLRDHLSDTPITALCHDNMEGVQWSKLLMNLNNALNALSGLGLRDQLQTRAWRQVLAACIKEGLAVARAEGIALERIGKVHPRILPIVLRLPDFIFQRFANAMLRVDPTARSSMADDYAAGRAPEVAWLNGHIVARGAVHGVLTPVNQRVCALVERAFDTSDRRPLSYNPQEIFIN
ncbi:2-dehydropantoate 2-reductase [Yoonia sp. 2307UL14-13]|uniref:2-dehydropantoate 2-reductase n=1 Tax=Yoonia sp. 2307UL14-13 TaxID=3126506 RepID=UPI0030B1D693